MTLTQTLAAATRDGRAALALALAALIALSLTTGGSTAAPASMSAPLSLVSAASS